MVAAKIAADTGPAGVLSVTPQEGDQISQGCAGPMDHGFRRSAVRPQ